MKLSLIIPIYNAELYLPGLFFNLESQGVFVDNEELGEVIFINDGSIDSSASIINKYAKKHSWVKLINQINQGQNIARNHGIREAKGDYIAFMDQDDAYAPTGLLLLYNAINVTNSQIVRGHCQWPDEEAFEKWKEHQIGSMIINNCSTGLDFLIRTDGLVYNSNVWGAIYDKKFIKDNKFFFNEDFNLYEDGVFNWKIMIAAKKVVQLSNTVYFWTQRNNSTSHNKSRQHRFKRESQRIKLAIFFIDLLKITSQINKFPSKLTSIIKREITWNIFGYIYAIVRFKGVNRNKINIIIQELKKLKVYPYCHTFPQNLPKGYPSTFMYKFMYKMLSYEIVLKIILLLRTKKRKCPSTD